MQPLLNINRRAGDKGSDVEKIYKKPSPLKRYCVWSMYPLVSPVQTVNVRMFTVQIYRKDPNIKTNHRKFLAGPPGVEPGLQGPKSCVMPLYERPILHFIYPA